MTTRPATHPRHPNTDRPPLWALATAGGYAVLAAGSAVIAALHPALLVSSHAQINDAVHVYAGYLISRNTAIALVLAGSLILRRHHALGAGLAFAALTQILDIAVDAATGRWTLLPGLFVLTALLTISAYRLIATRRLTGNPSV